MHADRENRSAKFWLDPDVLLEANHGHARKELRDIERMLKRDLDSSIVPGFEPTHSHEANRPDVLLACRAGPGGLAALYLPTSKLLAGKSYQTKLHEPEGQARVTRSLACLSGKCGRGLVR